jgi:hypothetical protein
MDLVKDGGKQTDYFSYLLRMWRDSEDEGARPSKEVLWRASLQSPRTGDLVGFASLDALFDFLRVQSGLEPVAKERKNEE